MNVLGFIPARAGSKSILGKNKLKISGKPLVRWVVDAANKSKTLSYLICSTDDAEVATLCKNDAYIVKRPKRLAQGNRPIHEVIQHAINGVSWDIVVLLQPTSLFVRPQDIDDCVDILMNYPHYNSAQTIARMPHNHHAFNQRFIVGDRVEFMFKEERKRCFNKQTKPELFVFGNVVATRVSALDAGVFAEPSFPILIPREYAFDLDGPEDLEWLRKNKSES